MMSKKVFTAVVAAASLIWGSAHAAPEATEGAPGEMPGVIILELAPGMAGQAGSEQEQAMMALLLLQLLGAMQVEGDPSQAPQLIAPASSGDRI